MQRWPSRVANGEVGFMGATSWAEPTLTGHGIGLCGSRKAGRSVQVVARALALAVADRLGIGVQSAEPMRSRTVSDAEDVVGNVLYRASPIKTHRTVTLTTF